MAKCLSKAVSGASENGLEIQTRFFEVLGCLWTPFTLFGAFSPIWEPFGLPLDAFWQLLEAFRSAENLPRFGRELAEVQPRVCRDSLRFRRELAEVLPRVCRDSAKNPPYEPQANLPFTLRLLRMDCVLRQTLRQNRRK